MGITIHLGKLINSLNFLIQQMCISKGSLCFQLIKTLLYPQTRTQGKKDMELTGSSSKDKHNMLCEDNYTQKYEPHLQQWHPMRSRKPVLAFHTTKLDPVVQWIQEHRKPLLSKHPLFKPKLNCKFTESLPEKNLKEKLIPQPFLTWTKHHTMLGSRSLPRASQKVTCY